MKELLCIFTIPFFLLCINPSFAGQLYIWTDENGMTHISDSPRKQVSEKTIRNKPKTIKKTFSMPQKVSCLGFDDKFDFRKVNWGMTQNQVKMIERDINFRISKTPFAYDIGECVAAEINCFNRTMVLSYTFLKNKLVLGQYTYLGSFNKNSDLITNKDLEKNIYKELKSKLISRHGKPITEDKFVKPQEYFSMWENNTSKILLKVGQLTYFDDFSCTISYESKNYNHLIYAAKAEANRKTNEEVDEYIIDTETESTIKPFCRKEWPKDYEMQKYCVDEQKKALAKLLEEKPNDIPSKIFDAIRVKCREEWPNDYNMRFFCEKKQIKAWRDLN